MLARRLTASPTADAGWLVGVDFEATKNQWLCVITASAGLERKSSQYSVGLSKDQEVAQKSLRPARQLCTTPSSPIPLGWKVFCKPPGNPRGLFFGDARGVQGKQRRSSRTQLCKRAQNDAGTCNACKLGLEGSCPNGFGGGTNPAVGWIEQAVTSTLPVHPASDRR